MPAFTDGVVIKTDGPTYRVVHLRDGYYVVGKNLMCPVDSKREGEDLITELLYSEGGLS